MARHADTVRIVRCRTKRALALASVSLVAGGLSAQAEPATIGSTVYLREGPGANYRPVDEAAVGREADRLGCGDGWCRIRLGGLLGYVPSEALAPPPGMTTRPQTCFVSRQLGHGGGRDLQVCHPAAQAP